MEKDIPRDRLTFSQTYTLNDFHFDGDSVYGQNRIAGVPIHLYEAELLYVTPTGFYAGPNVQWNVTRYPADQANTLFADSYALLGFEDWVSIEKRGLHFPRSEKFDGRTFCLRGESYGRRADNARRADFSSWRRSGFLRWDFVELVMRHFATQT